MVGCPVDHSLCQLEAVFIADRFWELLVFGLGLRGVGGLARYIKRFIDDFLTVHQCEVSRLSGWACAFDVVVLYDADFVLVETVEDTVFC